MLILFLFLLHFRPNSAQYVTPQYAEIRAVSAMCSSDGITASIDFDKPFTGKIYSLNYANVDDCLYYNNIDRDTVLFSIPSQLCGTKLERTTRNMIDQMENRVYVQMDKDTQTASDKQFSFVCRLSAAQNGNTTTMKTNDVYPTAARDHPIQPVVPNSVSTKMMVPTNLPPITPTSVHQVAAFSRDAHLGNWPIPGSTPYDASMRPVSTYPLSPPPAVAPITPLLHHDTKQQQESYVTPPPRHVSMVGHQSTTSMVPQRAPPIAARVFTTQPPSPPPIIPNVHFRQGVGVPFAADPPTPATKIDADKWNDPNAYVTPPTHGDVTTTTTTVRYREQPPPTANAPFSSDTNTNMVHDVEPSPPSSPIPSILLRTTQQQQSQGTTPIETPEVTLEIQRGEGPFAPPVTTPIKIGDNISLVVRAKSFLVEQEQFDMFVHSCYATDGKGDAKVQIIDENGCVIRREFASPLHRAKDSDHLMFYYVMIKAFKFPGPDDVYFSCTIEMTPGVRAPNICSKLRKRRQTLGDAQSAAMRLFDSVRVRLADLQGQQEPHPESNDAMPLKDSASDCESEKHVYIGVIILLFVAIATSLVANLVQFARTRRPSK